jgi:DNA-directed RNA polymerase specialized sigma24 family protein
MDDSGELRLAPRHVAELSDFFAAHDRWLFGRACVRTRGDRELAADLVQDTFEAAARAWAMLRGHGGGRQRARLTEQINDQASDQTSGQTSEDMTDPPSHEETRHPMSPRTPTRPCGTT